VLGQIYGKSCPANRAHESYRVRAGLSPSARHSRSRHPNCDPGLDLVINFSVKLKASAKDPDPAGFKSAVGYRTGMSIVLGTETERP
jgi:hypothetical protein